MTRPASPPLPRKAYRADEVAEMIGLSRDAIYDLCQSGELRSRKVGTKWIIPAAAVDEFIRATA